MISFNSKRNSDVSCRLVEVTSGATLQVDWIKCENSIQEQLMLMGQHFHFLQTRLVTSLEKVLRMENNFGLIQS